ncbi:MAG: hypothetical protein Q8Q36_00640 [bacterium]|nr:hypothetical protein [bacterium]
MKFKVYCDTGGFARGLRSLEENDEIELLYYPYENKNKKIEKRALPSATTWNDMTRPWDEEVNSWEEYIGSEKFPELEKILSLNNRKDILHLDSAYKSRCQFFISSDKGDIYQKRNELFRLLNITVCLHTDLSKVIDAIKEKNQRK